MLIIIIKEVNFLLRKILRSLFTIVGLVVGYLIADMIMKAHYFLKFSYLKNSMPMTILFIIFCMVLFGFIFFLISPWIIKMIASVMEYFEKNLQKIPANEILFGTGGAIVALIIVSLIVNLFPKKSVLVSVIEIILAVIFAALGADIAIRKRDDLINFFSNVKKSSGIKEKKAKAINPSLRYLILL